MWNSSVRCGEKKNQEFCNPVIRTTTKFSMAIEKTAKFINRLSDKNNKIYYSVCKKKLQNCSVSQLREKKNLKFANLLREGGGKGKHELVMKKKLFYEFHQLGMGKTAKFNQFNQVNQLVMWKKEQKNPAIICESHQSVTKVHVITLIMLICFLFLLLKSFFSFFVIFFLKINSTLKLTWALSELFSAGGNTISLLNTFNTFCLYIIHFLEKFII